MLHSLKGGDLSINFINEKHKNNKQKTSRVTFLGAYAIYVLQMKLTSHYSHRLTVYIQHI